MNSFNLNSRNRIAINKFEKERERILDSIKKAEIGILKKRAKLVTLENQFDKKIVRLEVRAKAHENKALLANGIIPRAKYVRTAEHQANILKGTANFRAEQKVKSNLIKKAAHIKKARRTVARKEAIANKMTAKKQKKMQKGAQKWRAEQKIKKEKRLEAIRNRGPTPKKITTVSKVQTEAEYQAARDAEMARFVKLSQASTDAVNAEIQRKSALVDEQIARDRKRRESKKTKSKKTKSKKTKSKKFVPSAKQLAYYNRKK